MPRGSHPNSRANLVQNSERTPKERKEQAKKAGIASAESRALYKSLNEDLREQCTPEKISAINKKMISLAKRGNLRAYELIRDGLGEKPITNVSISTSVSEAALKVAEILGDE